MNSTDLLPLAFGLGWAVADEAHLPALPEALSRLLRVPTVRVTVVQADGALVLEHRYPAQRDQEVGESTNMHIKMIQFVYETEEALDGAHTLRISVESPAELSPAQAETLAQAMPLMRSALACILVGQRGRDTLGEPFARLSDREWKICLALEKPDGEKQIAHTLSCSRHTVHGYVKSLYRKLQVQSRLQMLDMLRRSREGLRRKTLACFDPERPRAAMMQPAK